MKSRQSALWIVASLAALLGLVAPPGAARSSWIPEKPVEIVVGSVPGGGAAAYPYAGRHPGDAHDHAVARMGFLANDIPDREHETASALPLEPGLRK